MCESPRVVTAIGILWPQGTSLQNRGGRLNRSKVLGEGEKKLNVCWRWRLEVFFALVIRDDVCSEISALEGLRLLAARLYQGGCR